MRITFDVCLHGYIHNVLCDFVGFLLLEVYLFASTKARKKNKSIISLYCVILNVSWAYHYIIPYKKRA